MRRRLVELCHETETRMLKPANLRTTPLASLAILGHGQASCETLNCLICSPRLHQPIIAAVASPLLTHPDDISVRTAPPERL